MFLAVPATRIRVQCSSVMAVLARKGAGLTLATHVKFHMSGVGPGGGVVGGLAVGAAVVVGASAFVAFPPLSTRYLCAAPGAAP